MDNLVRENKKTSNNIIEVINGKYVRGQMDKKTLGGGSKGFINEFIMIMISIHLKNLLMIYKLLLQIGELILIVSVLT